MPDQNADQEDQRRDHPVELGAERQRVVVRQHQEHDRQRQVVVVQRARLGDAAIFGVRLAPCNQVGNHDFLVGDDDQEHVGRHDRRGECTDMQEGRASAENLRVAPRHHHQDRKQNQHQQRVVVAQSRLAQLIIHQPAQHQRAERQRDGDRRRHVQHITVDQEQVGPGIIDNRQERETRHPGGIGFPLEPGQMLRQPLRRDQIFLDMVEPAAMDLPFLAMRADRHSFALHQTEIERDEIEG